MTTPADPDPLISVREAELPDGVAAVLMSPVQPDEVLPGETVADAMARLRRAVVIRDDRGPA